MSTHGGQRRLGGCTATKLRMLMRVIERRLDEHLGKMGITDAQCALLEAVAAHERCTVSALAVLMGLTPSTMSRNLQVLSTAGLLRASQGVDRRRRVVSLTAKGRLKLQEARPKASDAAGALQAMLGERLTAELEAHVQECCSILDADGPPPQDRSAPPLDDMCASEE